MDYRSPAICAIPRKPVGSVHHAGLQFDPFRNGASNTTSYSNNADYNIYSSHDYPAPLKPRQPPQRQLGADPSSYLPTPAQLLPAMNPAFQPHPSQQMMQQQQQQYRPSRNPSSATSSTTSTGGNGFHGHHASGAQASVRRSSSSRSTNSQSGYVALMRRQKATVWCDRAQTEDPRIVQARRLAKQKAKMEVHQGAGAAGSGRSSTLLSTGKIRHTSGARSMTYNTGTMVGAAVPMRLSANEVGEADDELERGASFHRRPSDSVRSSTGSSRFGAGYLRQSPQSKPTDSNINPEVPDTRLDVPEIVETPVQMEDDQQGFYQRPAGGLRLHNADSKDRNEYEMEESLDKITEMATPTGAAATAAQKRKIDNNLKRSGSVDDRTSSMAGVKLFIANPDLSD